MNRAFEPLRRLCQEAVDAGVVPGAVVGFVDGGAELFFEAFGARQIDPERLPLSTATIFDVASLTKAVVTSVLAMHAVADGTIGLDDPVARHLPEFAGPQKDAVTVRHLLGHSAGLPAHRQFYLQVEAGPRRRLEISRAAAAEALASPPGTRAIYTDLGFILLGWLLERARGARLDELAARELGAPLGLRATAFGPLTAAALPPPAEIAATERCAWRQRLLVGEVHDQNAWAMDGVAGHAGLFSTAGDLLAIARALMAAWRGELRSPHPAVAGPPLVERDVIRGFWAPTGVPGSTWRLGWDGPAERGSQAGERLDRAAVGHLGFTGCSLWIDPTRERIIVLLTNRIHPTVRDDPRFRAFRPAVQDAAIAATSP